MKTLKINSFKMRIQILLLVILFISACAQSGKEAKANTSNSTETKIAVGKPSIDIQSAVISGNLKAIKQHIKAKSNLNEKEAMSGSTPLISAATFGKNDIAKALIDAGADLSLKNNDGSTALHTAAFFGRIEIVKMLIDAKADKTIRNNFGATARETVISDFSQMKPIYKMLKQQLGPMGLQIDLTEIEKARPVIAKMLQ